VTCEDDSQCDAGAACYCASAFGSGVCLPTEWTECTFAPCDATCFYVNGDWICGLPGC
jgi:hypothetical protein